MTNKEDNPALLNFEAIQSLKALEPPDGGSFFKEIIELYVSTLPQSIESIFQAFDSKQWTSLSEAAHSLKSSSGNVGAEKLRQLCARLEREARSSDKAQIAVTLTEIKEVAQLSIQALQKVADLSRAA